MRNSKLVLVVVALAVCGCDPNAATTEPAAAAPAADTGVRRIEPSAATPPVDAARAPAAGTGMAALDALPWAERLSLEQALAADNPRFAPRMGEHGPVLGARGSATATFTGSGAQVALGTHTTTLQVAAIGRGRAVRALSAGARVEVTGPEVRISRGAGVVEWWRSLPSGLEHGVTIAGRPAGDGELRVEVAVSGELAAKFVSDDSVELRDAGGARVATYAHLVVLDAAGAAVPARMSVDDGRIVLAVNDAEARYPLVIDPLVTAQEAMLVAPDSAAGDFFGCSVALTSDGSRALVGVLADDTAGGVDAGSARVFVRTGTIWAQEATLVAPDGAAGACFGGSVALSADGSRALVGAYADDTAGGVDTGSARVFLRTGTAWVQEATLLATDGAANDRFGWSVALTSDGSRALVGATQDDAAGVVVGSARVFLRTGTAWAQETTLLAPDGAANDNFGHSVAITADGTRALVGAIGDDTAGGVDAGSARVFLRTGITWAQEATLLAPDGAANDHFGASVALASDGSRALVGAQFDTTAAGWGAGSARVFSRTGTAWAHEATLVAPDGDVGDQFGYSVALTVDGSCALVGAPSDLTAGGMYAGSAHVCLRTGTAWAHEATLLAPDGAASDWFGWSVALTSDGGLALAGALGDETTPGNGTGSARVFTIALAPNGAACGGDTACASGFCTDGVCCGTRCAGGAGDCQACSAALTSGADGTCAPLSMTAAPTVICRASTGPCDVAETCASSSAVCPTDTFASTATVCRAPVDLCDVAETCTGTAAACPGDAVASAGTICHPVLTACDQAETCDGASVVCPVTDSPALGGTICRASTGACDAAEVCDGIAFTCPGDVLFPAGSPCRPALGLCDLAEVCTGTSAACPPNVLVAAGLICRSSVPGGCDIAETCTGVLPACPDDLFAASSTLCGPAVSGVCDAADHCSGTSADCVETYLSAVECRASNGSCDTPEVCLGDAPSCPLDAVASAGLSCRPSTDTACDPEETCDGVDTSCPIDMTTCVADAGPAEDGSVADDAGDALDATVAGDAGALPVASSGCGCRVAHGRDSRAALFTALFAFGVLAVRRRRAR